MRRVSSSRSRGSSGGGFRGSRGSFGKSSGGFRGLPGSSSRYRSYGSGYRLWNVLPPWGKVIYILVIIALIIIFNFYL